MPQLSFFIGKGGVGKSTVSSAYAVWKVAREPRKSVLLLSTDPAPNLADLFEIRLGSSPQQIELPWRTRLFVWELDAAKQFTGFLKRHRSPILQVIESGTMFTRDEIAPLLDATLPGIAEVAALITIYELLQEQRYDEIVIDTAPMGHTLRLFQMPERFRRFLAFLDAAAMRDRVLAERFAGTAPVAHDFISQWRMMVTSVQQAMRSDARLVLVTTPEKLSLAEGHRAAAELAGPDSQLQITQVVLNRAVPHAGNCRVCAFRARSTVAALRFIRRSFPSADVCVADDSGGPIIGARELRAFGEHVFERKGLRPGRKPPGIRSRVQFTECPWPSLKTPLSLTIGKGGVGKTTISAAVAMHHRAHNQSGQVTICSTDPAPSLGDIFRRPVGDRATPVLGDTRFTAIEVDAVAEFRRWSEALKANLDRTLRSQGNGVHVDFSLDREVFIALLDVVPPGVDEIFGALRMLDLVGRGSQLVLDMAPTGHALELLRTPDRLLRWSRLLLKTLAAHRRLPFARDAAVEIAELDHRVEKLARMLRNSRQAQVLTVMLPEPLPDRETRRLLDHLSALKIRATTLFVNRVRRGLDDGCLRCRRRQEWQHSVLAKLRRRGSWAEIYVVPEFPGEITGARQLQRLTRRIWRLA